MSRETTDEQIKASERKRARLTLIFPGPEKEINIFIHGYSAVTSRSKFEKLSSHILSAKPPGQIYLLCWRAGSWKTPAWAQTLLTISRTAYRAVKIGEIFSPAAFVADAAVLTASEMILYRYYENRSEKLGDNLKDYIRMIPQAKNYKINLIGHSLGARVIHYALSLHEWSDYHINDCIFLGGAADADKDNWEECLSRINGNIYNAYSKRDLILKVIPDMKKRVGRHPIQCSSSRIINRNYPSFHHLDYWPRLGYILPHLWKNFRPSPYIDLVHGYPAPRKLLLDRTAIPEWQQEKI